MGHIRVIHLGKAYKRYAKKSSRILEWLGLGTHHQPHWVLQDIDFQIQPGEAVGIIGVNGAGKSTLLKLIAGVMQPTTGSIELQGRVAALLELGMGFQGDFTGRQNVHMSGLLAGMTPQELQGKMAEIEAFAEIGDYIDQPVRTYSSGMQVRLAFSVATAVRPDVLIVDEALAVGDVFFQQKCFERIRSFLQQGTTLLFVSHSAATVYTLCNRAILIDGGRVALDGSPRQVIDLYNALVASRSGTGALPVTITTGTNIIGAGAADPSQTVAMPGGTIGSYAHNGVSITTVQLTCAGVPAHSVISGSRITARVVVQFHHAFSDPHVGFQIRDRRGEAVFMTHTHGMHQKIGPVQPGEQVEVQYSFDVPLITGDYTFTVGVAQGGLMGGAVADPIARTQDAWAFQVVTNLDDIHWNGLCHLHPSVGIQRPLPAARAGRGLLVTTSHSLLWLDEHTGQTVPLHRGAGLYYGIASDAQHIYVGARKRLVSSATPASEERGCILVFNHQLQLQDTWSAPFALRDIHEIAMHEGTLWITCSHDDMVALRHPDGQWQAWYPLGEPQGEPRDVHHYNSFAFTPGTVHLLAHNRGASERLEFNLSDRSLRARHPLGQQAHNLWQQGGQWHTCSSGEGRLLGDAGFALSTGGFPRGIARLGAHTAIGISQLAERQQRDLTDGHIHIYNDQWQLQHQWTLPSEGLVLDIKPCP